MRDKRQSTMTMMPKHANLHPSWRYRKGCHVRRSKTARIVVVDHHIRSRFRRAWRRNRRYQYVRTYGRRCRRYYFHDPPRRCSKKKKKKQPPTRGMYDATAARFSVLRASSLVSPAAAATASATTTHMPRPSLLSWTRTIRALASVGTPKIRGRRRLMLEQQMTMMMPSMTKPDWQPPRASALLGRSSCCCRGGRSTNASSQPAAGLGHARQHTSGVANNRVHNSIKKRDLTAYE